MDKTQELVKYQQGKARTVDNGEEWKRVLVDECRTLESLRFRCSVEAVGKIVPELTAENIEMNREKYVLSNTLKILFEKP